MNTTLRAARALAEGRTTAEALAERLGIDPDDVSGAVDDLREAGFEIDSEGGAYRVASVPEYGPGVAYGLPEPYSVEYHGSIGSTNDRGRELAEAGESDVVVLAGRQTGGRGREGRSWSSPPGGIYASLVVRPDLPARRAGLLTLAAAVAVARAVRETGAEAAIKWPNDVLAPDGGKLAGILTEASTASGGIEWAVVGIGVNANVDPDDLPEGSASVAEQVGEVERREVIHRLLRGFDALRGDPGGIADAWREHAATLGRRVRVETADGAIVGEARDVDDEGNLVVETEDGTATVAAGDCEHLRRA